MANFFVLSKGGKEKREKEENCSYMGKKVDVQYDDVIFSPLFILLFTC